MLVAIKVHDCDDKPMQVSINPSLVVGVTKTDKGCYVSTLGVGYWCDEDYALIVARINREMDRALSVEVGGNIHTESGY